MAAGGSHLLLIEDDTVLAQELCEALGDLDVVPLSELSALDAADVAGQMLVMDLQLPGQNIFEFARRVHLWNAGGVILMSGHGGSVLQASERLLKELGVPVVACLQKPFDVHILRELACMHGAVPPLPARARFDEAAQLIGRIDRDGAHFGFQPKVDLRTRQLSGFEVLLMPLTHGQRVISPGEQITLAKSVPDLHESIVRQAVRVGLGVVRDIEDAGGAPLDISVNIEADLLRNGQLFEDLRRSCEAGSIPAERVTFELVETWAYGGDIFTSEGIIALRLHGFGIAVDDFGKGHSELMEIVNLPVTELKTDMALIQAMRVAEKARGLLAAINAFCKDYGIRSVAEGVETRQDIANVIAAGFDSAQGFAFGRKMDRATFIARAISPLPELFDPVGEGQAAGEAGGRVSSRAQLLER